MRVLDGIDNRDEGKANALILMWFIPLFFRHQSSCFCVGRVFLAVPTTEYIRVNFDDTI